MNTEMLANAASGLHSAAVPKGIISVVTGWQRSSVAYCTSAVLFYVSLCSSSLGNCSSHELLRPRSLLPYSTVIDRGNLPVDDCLHTSLLLPLSSARLYAHSQ